MKKKIQKKAPKKQSTAQMYKEALAVAQEGYLYKDGMTVAQYIFALRVHAINESMRVGNAHRSKIELGNKIRNVIDSSN